MKKETDPIQSDDQDHISTARIRENFSMDEIQRLLVDIGHTVSSHKAEQIGLDPENMVKTIRGGRVVWITIDEMNMVLSKQRRIATSKHIKQKIRKEDNLSNESTQRVDACRSLINTIRKLSQDESPLFTRLFRTLESLQNFTVGQAQELRVLEAAIQRKKKEDPILQEVERATEEMVSALKEDELADVDVCRSFCDRHMDDYLIRQRRIEPYIKKAKEHQLSFMLSKQQFIQFQFELFEKVENTLFKHLEEVLYYDKNASISNRLLEQSNEVRTMLNDSHLFFEQLSSLTPEELLARENIFVEAEKNHLSPLLQKMLNYAELFNTAWSQFVEET
jgi:hypothetical protein